jgi:hypothetical protein
MSLATPKLCSEVADGVRSQFKFGIPLPSNWWWTNTIPITRSSLSFDWDWVWGNCQDSSHDKSSGDMSIWGNSGIFYGGLDGQLDLESGTCGLLSGKVSFGKVWNRLAMVANVPVCPGATVEDARWWIIQH